MGFQNVLEAKQGMTGCNITKELVSLTQRLPGKSITVTGKVLHKYLGEAEPAMTFVTPTSLYKKFKALWPNKHVPILQRILDAVPGDVHFVFITAGALRGQYNHVIYMRTW